MNTKKIKGLLETEVIGQNLVCFDELDSTNTYSRLHGEKYPHGTIVIANRQTAGKGSRGRSWESSENVSVYMTFILKPDIQPVFAPRLTPVMALSVARALQKLGIDAQIKWPNDIVLHGKKVTGILTEMSATSQHVNQVIVGVGINVLTEHFSEEIQHRATSLFLETGIRYSRSEMIAAVANCFEQDYEKFLQTCDLSQLLEQYKQFSATVGKEVRILDTKGEYTGQAVDVDALGQLLVRKEDGQFVKVFADEVSVRGIYGYV